MTNAVSGGATVGLLSIVGGARMPYMIAGGVMAIAVTILLSVFAKRICTVFAVVSLDSIEGNEKR